VKSARTRRKRKEARKDAKEAQKEERKEALEAQKQERKDQQGGGEAAPQARLTGPVHLAS
jgi:hypothetical protein